MFFFKIPFLLNGELVRFDSGCCPVSRMSLDNNHNHFRKTKKKKIFGAVHSECLLINRLSITQSGMSFCCGMKFLRHCGEPNRFWWRSLYVALECILLCRRGMCGIGKGWPGIPKTIKLLKQMLLWGVEGEKVLIQFPPSHHNAAMWERLKKILVTPPFLCHTGRTVAKGFGIEVSNHHQGQKGATWVNSFITLARELFGGIMQMPWTKWSRSDVLPRAEFDSARSRLLVCDDFLSQVECFSVDLAGCARSTHPSVTNKFYAYV